MDNEFDIRKTIDENSKQATSVARQLAIAGAGVCWLFKDSKDIIFPAYIYASLVCFSLFFIFDVLQYAITAFRYLKYGKKVEAAKKNIGSSDAIVRVVPESLNLPSYVLFSLKMIALFVAYSGIAFEIVKRIGFS